MKQTRKDIIRKLAPRISVTEKQAEHIFMTTIEILTDILNNNDQIIIRGFGRFKPIEIPERMVRDPNTGERFLKPAHRTPE